MTDTHTPGPWIVDQYGDVQANGEDIARIATGDDHAAADARLIAAAPELLAALIELRDWYAGFTRMPTCDASAAIAKARGLSSNK